MANHMREGGADRDRNAKQASLLASAQSAQRRQRGADAGDAASRQRSGDAASRQRSGDAAHAGSRSREVGAVGSTRGVRAGDAGRSRTGARSRAYRDDASRTDAESSRASVGQPRASRGERARHGRSQQQPDRESLGAFVRRNSVYIISVVAVIAIATLMLVFMRGCIPEAQDDAGEASGSAAGASVDAAAYDWSLLDTNDGRYRYVVDGQVRSRLGIDVSENQHEIDWQAVADDGIEFAIIRLGYRGATEGDLYLDEYYEQNLAGAKAAGIDCGVYFFSQAQSMEEAVAEADFVVEHLDGVQLECPIGFDSEEAVLNVEESRTSGLSDTSMTFIAEAFCARVAQAGYRSLVYGNGIDLSRYYYESMDSRDFWWAEYGVAHPSTDFVIDMWQYSNAGTVAGIETEVDMNIDLSNVTGS